MNETLPRSLLVANRGEIARRVFRTARGMGMRCVAVFADADADAPFVREADVAIRLPGGYLDAASVLNAARRSGAEAVHPGYGFLSENAAFARDVVDAGLIWVGPTPEVIESMGDKTVAKTKAIDAGVPTLPSMLLPGDTTAIAGADRRPGAGSSWPGADSSWPGLFAAGAQIGYPLLVKAAAGGGGKGMRIVERPGDLDASVAAARREALSGFGDDRVFLERYVSGARHVEIQILGDTLGNILHLGERECSIQRRHQKIIEEAPSPALDATLRHAMGEAAITLARAIGYTSAGTVEFLLDDATGEFYFLEVNTRLQVEHPVTEAVTGIDLVREQLRIAVGEPLGYDQNAVAANGHAIEARLYAEDPDNDFLPATGALEAFGPAAEPAVRWDAGVEQGSLIGVDFDPMIAKVVAHAPSRAEAAGRLGAALERLHIAGVRTNRDFLAATLRHRAFLSGDTTTDFIERVRPEPVAHDIPTAAVAAAMALRSRNRSTDRVWGFAPSNWRNAVLPAERISFRVRGVDEPVEVSYRARRDGSFEFDDGSIVCLHGDGPAGLDLEIDGIRATRAVTVAGDRVHVQTGATTVSLTVQPRFALRDAEPPTGALTAPMPGIVSEIRCAVGDRVAAGDVLVVLEAMKMEHHIAAPFGGTVAEVRVAAGEQVDNGALLLNIDETADSATDDPRNSAAPEHDSSGGVLDRGSPDGGNGSADNGSGDNGAGARR